MAKLSKETQWRNEGMAYALSIAKESGVDALEDELKMRGIADVPIRVNKQKTQEFCDNVKLNVVNHVLLLALVTLRDEFSFGEKRLKQFQARFNDKAECVAGDWTTWEEQVKVLTEEVGIEYVEYMKDVTVRV